MCDIYHKQLRVTTVGILTVHHCTCFTGDSADKGPAIHYSYSNELSLFAPYLTHEPLITSLSLFVHLTSYRLERTILNFHQHSLSWLFITFRQIQNRRETEQVTTWSNELWMKRGIHNLEGFVAYFMVIIFISFTNHNCVTAKQTLKYNNKKITMQRGSRFNFFTVFDDFWNCEV